MSKTNQFSETLEDALVRAIRTKVRFPSVRGPLTMEQLFDMPLRSSDGFNLNEVAKAVNKDLKGATEENFVPVAGGNPTATKLGRALTLVQTIIDIKVEEEEAAALSAANKQKKEKLLKILAEKQDGALSELSMKELQKQIDALG